MKQVITVNEIIEPKIQEFKKLLKEMYQEGVDAAVDGFNITQKLSDARLSDEYDLNGNAIKETSNLFPTMKDMFLGVQSEVKEQGEKQWTDEDMLKMYEQGMQNGAIQQSGGVYDNDFEIYLLSLKNKQP